MDVVSAYVPSYGGNPSYISNLEDTKEMNAKK